MEYPKSTNIKKWEQYLERKLDITEKRLLHNASQEVQLNKCIYNLIKNIKNKNLYIPTLSVSDGNCLYDSICYKLKDNTPIDIRNIISSFMKLYKKYPDVFPSQNMTLEDMFACQNDIDYIYDKNTNKLYKYIIPYLELDYKENDLILIWFEQIKQNKKCNSFVPKKEFDTAYYKNIFN